MERHGVELTLPLAVYGVIAEPDVYILGTFREQLWSDRSNKLKIHTKCVRNRF